MQIDSLARGRGQPFYRIYGVDGSQRCMWLHFRDLVHLASFPIFTDVAEENMEPASISIEDLEVLQQEFADLPLLFEGIESGEMRRRLLLSPDLTSVYPDDDRYGSDWIAVGDAVED